MTFPVLGHLFAPGGGGLDMFEIEQGAAGELSPIPIAQ